MKRILGIAVLLAAVLSFTGSGLRPSLAAEAGKKEPVRFKVINTFKPDLAGVEKAQLIQFEMDPGAVVKNFTVSHTEILWVTKGAFTYKYGDRVVQRKAGQSWLHEAGVVIDVTNKTKSTAVLRGVQFVKSK